MLHHNGECPCHRCLVKRRLAKNSDQLDVQDSEKAMLPLLKSNQIARRTLNLHSDHVAIIKDLKESDPKEVHYEGVKGPTILQEIEKFNSLEDTERIFSLKVPSSTIRKIRGFEELSDFKSSEYQYFLFFYSYFIFKDILPEDIFNHFMLLSSFTFKLYSRHSNSDDVNDAVKAIDFFLEELGDPKYKPHFRVYNRHMIVL